jgi:outer membrane murein-binding lipoprotein Lpp
MDWVAIATAYGPAGVVLVAGALWLRSRVSKGKLTIESQTARELQDKVDKANAERDEWKARAEKAEACAACAEKRADEYQERLIKRLEVLVNVKETSH